MKTRRYNEKLLGEIERLCLEKYEDVQVVNEEFYDAFITLSNSNMKAIVQLILHSTYKYINENIISGKWKEEDLYEHFMMYLELLFEGKIGFREEDREICFLKPIGDLPSDEMWEKLQSRITASRSVIEAVLRETLGRQASNRVTSEEQSLKWSEAGD